MANENNLPEVFLATALESLDNRFKKLDELAGKLKDTPELVTLLKDLKKELEESKILYRAVLDLNGKLEKFSANLGISIKLLKAPVENKVVHHYPRLLWATAGLFLCLVCCGWLVTTGKLEAYRASNTKYRFLKLKDNKNLKQLLLQTDSLLLAYPGLHDTILLREEQQRVKLELLQQAKNKEREAAEMKKKAGKL